ncbi:MAG: amidohydrolase family protein [Rhodospirillales bacterium]|nr:amidohydrolase family protein [Acetobacter sp.]
MRVDAHHHFWHYNAREFPWIGDDAPTLRRDFLPADLEAVLNAADVQLAVSVQARSSLAETRFLLQCASQMPEIAKVVGWVPLTAPDLPVLLEEFAENTAIAGFREIVQDEHAGYLLAPSFNGGIRQLTSRGYTYDILIRAPQLEETIAFVDQHPRQRFVLDHAAKPLIAQHTLEPWRTQVKHLAERSHVFCKLSGLVTEADWQRWTDAELEPYLDTCLEAFGPKRLMAGSDWPVCLAAISYGRWWRLLERWTGRLSQDEQAHILGLNAANFYAIPIGREASQ